MDYRGYGESTGSPSEAGLRIDARATLRALAARSDIDVNKIVLFGRSLGGAVALELARACSVGELRDVPRPRAVVVENTFTSVEDMVLNIFPFTRPIRTVLPWLLKSHWPTLSLVRVCLRATRERVSAKLPCMLQHTRTDMPAVFQITHVQMPVLFISGTRDELVPPDQMQQLYNACPSPYKHLYTVENGTHNDTFMVGGVPYYVRVKEFLEKHVTPAARY